MNAVRNYGSAGNQVFHPLGDDIANLINSYRISNIFTLSQRAKEITYAR